ncbi:MAG: hypothetical protein AAF579_12245 [Cyanobacteria bacterium P01_C01_bin.118]
MSVAQLCANKFSFKRAIDATYQNFTVEGLSLIFDLELSIFPEMDIKTRIVNMGCQQVAKPFIQKGLCDVLYSGQKVS